MTTPVKKPEVFYPLPSIANSSENPLILTIVDIVALILDHVPSSELGKVARVNKIFYSSIYTVPKLRLKLFLERAKKAASSIEDDFDQEVKIQNIVKLEVLINIREAKTTLGKITKHTSTFSKGPLEVVKKEVALGQMEQAKVTVQTIAFPYDQFLGWLEIIKKQRIEENIKKTVEIIGKLESNFNSTMAYLKLWNIDRNKLYLLKIKELLKELSALQKLHILVEKSKFEPTLKNVQKAKKHITLLSEPPPQLSKVELKKQLDAAITIWELKRDENLLKEIKTKTEKIEDTSTKFHVWRKICKAVPEKEHLEHLISLIPLISCYFKQAKTWILLFKFTKDGTYLKNARDAILRSPYLYHRNLIRLRIVQAKAEAGQIQEAKEDAKKILANPSLTTEAWIAIWKGQKSMEHLREVTARIITTRKSDQADLWVKLAEASSIS